MLPLESYVGEALPTDVYWFILVRRARSALSNRLSRS